ncbi:hypothetical protein BURMUCGD1_2155 [Burkholderia multivorans CGD1]|nr:hypothetical protein BURMUCGD1_2155 [Burkholderia multivorans CGD1]
MTRSRDLLGVPGRPRELMREPIARFIVELVKAGSPRPRCAP